MQLQLVTQRKKEYDEWRAQFREWVKQQRAEQSLHKRQQLALAMREAQDNGYSIADIMRAYGTTDRKTVTDILNLPLTVEAEPTEITVTAYNFELVGAGMYRVDGMLFMADDTPQGWYPYVEGPDAETDLGVALNDPGSELHKQAKEWLTKVCG